MVENMRLFILVVLVHCSLTYGFSQEVSACAEAIPGEIVYTWEAETSAAENETVLQARFNLTRADKPISVGVLAFYNGVQLDSLEERASLSCGKNTTFSVDIDNLEDLSGLLHVFPRWLPVIPDKIRVSTPSHKLLNSEAFKFGTRLADSYILKFGEQIQASKLSRSSSYTTISSKTNTEYLSTSVRSSTTPTYIRYLDDGVRTLDFDVVLGETSDEQSTYTVTCLLNDRQFAAFSGQRTWTGQIAKQQTAVVKAKVSQLTPGWHKIECLVLNGVVRDHPNRTSEFPHQINPLFVFVPTK